MKTLSENTVITVSNAIELVAKTLSQVAGEEVADTISGNKITEGALHEIIASQINKNLAVNFRQGANK